MKTQETSLQNKNMNQCSKKGKFFLFLFSFVIHIIVVLTFINMPIALDDMYQYDMLGRSLSSGLGYQWYSKADVEVLKPYLQGFLPLDEMTFPEDGILTTFRPPGYPFFLSVFYHIDDGPGRFTLVRLAQAVIFASLSILVVNIGEAIGLSKKRSIAAGIIISLYPILLFYPIALASENLFIPLFAWSIYIAWRVKQKSTTVWLSIILGLLLGAMVLTRSVSVLILIVITCWLFFTSKTRKFKALIPFVIAMIIVLPWAIRNSKVMGHPALVENSLWYNMYIGYHPEGDGNFVSDIAIKPLFITDDTERDAFTKQEALTFIKNDPLEALRRIINRIPAFFGPETREFNYFYSNNLVGNIPQPWMTLIYLLLTLPWFFVCLFGIIGLYTNLNRTFSVLVGLSLLLYFLPHLPILTEPRFHLALVPLMTPFAVDALSNGTKLQVIDKKKQKIKRLIIGLLVIFFISIWAIKIYYDFPLYRQLLSPGGNEIHLSY
jgi:4-amino-4-deoxy-L-arabinose transferase-like glycosyltransferase